MTTHRYCCVSVPHPALHTLPTAPFAPQAHPQLQLTRAHASGAAVSAGAHRLDMFYVSMKHVWIMCISCFLCSWSARKLVEGIWGARPRLNFFGGLR